MRKLFLLGTFFTAVVSFSLAHADNRVSLSFGEAAPVTVDGRGGEADSFLGSFPVFFSYDAGRWVTEVPGSIFTAAGDQPGFTAPYLIGRPVPIRYPRWALRQGWQGSLTLAIEIRKDGTVGRWKVMRPSGYPSLDRAAVRAVQNWLFEPGKKKGEPIASCIQIPLHFRLKKKDGLS